MQQLKLKLTFLEPRTGQPGTAAHLRLRLGFVYREVVEDDNIGQCHSAEFLKKWLILVWLGGRDDFRHWLVTAA